MYTVASRGQIRGSKKRVAGGGEILVGERTTLLDASIWESPEVDELDWMGLVAEPCMIEAISRASTFSAKDGSSRSHPDT